MSVMIKGMEMPKRCETCQFCKTLDMDFRTLKVQPYCCLTNTKILGNGNARLNNCPIVEIPTPHGRLIDADELLKNKTDHDMVSTHLIYNASTVIESED